MITAHEAYRKSTLNSKAKKYIEEIEISISKAVKSGKFEAKMNHGLTSIDENMKILTVIREELQESGYEVVCQVAKELPDGCRSDQWDFENGYIIIRWDNGGIK